MGSPPTSNVPFPFFGPNGIVIPDESAVLAGEQRDIDQAFGGGLNFSTASGSQTNPTPQGQLATSTTAVLGDNFALFAWYVSQVDPAFSTGRMQDGIGRIYFLYRIAGQPTVQPCLCSGLANVPVPTGLLATDESGNQWVCQFGGTIGASGSVVLDFQATVTGPTPAPTSFPQFQYVAGLDSIAPSGDAVLGNLVESPSQFEYRRSRSTGKNSMGPLNAVYAEVAAVPGVVDVYTFQNVTGAPLTVGGVTLQANQIYVAALGGSAADVAMAIYLAKMPGGPMYGSTTVEVPDPNPAYSVPVPVTPISFQVPTIVAFAVVVTITNSAAVPANALQLVALGTNLNGTVNGIVAGFNGLDGGSRAKIGSTVYASRYYGDVVALSNTNTFNGQTPQVIPGWSAGIVSIKVGISGAAAQFTGAISGNTLTVSGVTGTIAIGQLVQDATGQVANGTLITAGSGSSWTVSGAPQTVSSEAMTGTTLVDDVAVHIDQSPGIAVPNIHLILQ